MLTHPSLTQRVTKNQCHRQNRNFKTHASSYQNNETNPPQMLVHNNLALQPFRFAQVAIPNRFKPLAGGLSAANTPGQSLSSLTGCHQSVTEQIRYGIAFAALERTSIIRYQ
ncbi:hypothetical protein Pla100_27190 [Neorhodopirellula pilleata]|uniref:Uncharacterized protein n=1 Tax=Neorhodopirellula pilleata TaxID=2714738 RepID=A0A5C6ADB7_9BACT|nr:hypothetical protein Pla100_27190 [Neorhodopirellula pilleata]